MVQTVYRYGGYEGVYVPVTLTKPGTYTVKWSYEHYQIPDQFTLRFNGKELFNSHFVGGSTSGTFKIKVPEGGGKFAAITATNNPQTQWYFQLQFDAGPSKPIANPDRERTVELPDGSRKVKINVAANDTDDQGLDLASITIVTQPKYGKATPNADGTITYTSTKPRLDTFTYTIKDKDGNVSDPAKVTVLGDCPDPAPLVVTGDLHHYDNATFCEGVGTFGIGRQDATTILEHLSIRGRVLVFEDRVDIKGARITPLTNAGGDRGPLFFGDLTIAAGTAISSALSVTDTSEANRYHIAGLWFKPTKLQLSQDKLEVAGSFALPFQLGESDIDLPFGNSLVFTPSGVTLGGGKITLPKGDFTFFEKVKASYEGVTIEYQAIENILNFQGKVELKSSLVKADDDTSATPKLVLDFTADKYLRVKDGVPEFKGVFAIGSMVAKGGWGLDELKFTAETQAGVWLSAGVGFKFIFPFAIPGGSNKALSANAVVAFNPNWNPSSTESAYGLQEFTLGVQNLDLPLPPAPGIFLEDVEGSMKNFAPWLTEDISLEGKLKFTLGDSSLKVQADLTTWLGDGEGSHLDGNILNLELNGKASVGRADGHFKVAGGFNLTVIGDALLGIKGTVEADFDAGSIALKDAAVTGLAGLLSGTASGKFGLSPYASLSLAGGVALNFPKIDSWHGLAGKSLANANFAVQVSNDGNSSNDFIAAWEQLHVPINYLGEVLLTVGIKATFPGGLFSAPTLSGIFRAADVPVVGSWDTVAGQEWLMMQSRWSNEITDDLNLQVKFVDALTGDVRIIDEWDFDANGITVVQDLTGEYAATVIVALPQVGRWDLLLPTADYSFDSLEIQGWREAATPTLDVPSAFGDGYESGFEYRGFDLQPGSTVSFYVDSDDQGFDGQLLASGLAIDDTLHSFSFVPSPVPGDDDNQVYVYALIDSPGGVPEMIYLGFPFETVAPADLHLERDIQDLIADGEYFSYRLILTNEGNTPARGVTLVESVDGGIIDYVYSTQGDIEILDNGAFRLTLPYDFYQGDTIEIFVQAHADKYATHDTYDYDDTTGEYPDYEEQDFKADAFVSTTSPELDRTDNRSTSIHRFIEAEVAPVSTGGDLKVERHFTTDVTGSVGSVGYDLIVTNQGPEVVRGATLYETVMGGDITGYYARQLGGPNPVYNGQGLSVALPELQPGAKYVLPVNFQATEASLLTLQAEVRQQTLDIDHHNDFAIDKLDATVLGNEPGQVDAALRIGSVTEGADGLVLVQLQFISEGQFDNLASDIQVKISPGAGLTLLSTDAQNAATAPADYSYPTYDAATGVWALNGAIQGGGQIRTLNITLHKDNPAGGVFKAELLTLREHDTDSTPGNGVPTEDDIVITTIGQPNQAPVLANLIPDITVNEGEPFSFTIPATTFIDPDGDTIHYSITGVATGTPAYEGSYGGNYRPGFLPDWLSVNQNTGVISGTPRPDQSDQAYSVLVTASDSRGGLTSDIFRIAVNDVRNAPTPNKAYPDIVAFVGVPFSYQAPSNIPYDPTRAYFLDGDLYRYIPDTYQYNHFSYEQFDPASMPNWVYYGGAFIGGTPGVDQIGTYDLTLLYRNQYYDGQILAGSQIIKLTVVAIEPPVVATPIPTLTGTENVDFHFDVPADAFTDPNGDALGYWWTGLPNWLTYDLQTGALSGRPFQGDEGAFDAVLHASDGKLGVAEQTVHFVIANVNDAPEAGPEGFALLAGETITDSVALNDVDKDSDPLTWALVAGPSKGSITFNADGSFTYTANADATGTDFFTYQVSDGQLSSAVTKADLFIQGPPSGTADAYTARMNIHPDSWSGGWGNRILTVDDAHGVLANDGAFPNAVFQGALLETGPQHGVLSTFRLDGSFTYRPADDFFGTDSFTYRPTDGLLVGAPVTVTITVPFENRQAAGQFDTLNDFNDKASVTKPLTFSAAALLANDNARDGDPLTAVIVRGPQHGTLVDNADGTYTYTPDSGFRGTDYILYNPYDPYGPGVGIVRANIYVEATDYFIDARDDIYSTPVNTTLTLNAPGVIRNDADPDTSDLWAGDGNGIYYDRVLLVDGPQHGTLSYFGENGAFTYTPNAGFTGTDTFTYRSAEYNRPLGDGDLNPDRATVTILVGGTDDTPAPIAVADSYAALEDVILKVDVAHGVLANDIGAAGRTLVAELVTQTQSGRVFLSPYGNFRYEPATSNFDGSPLNQNGPQAFTYRVWDGSHASAPIAVVINVAPVSDIPLAPDVYDYRSQGFSSPVQSNLTSYGVGRPDQDGAVTAVNGVAANVGVFVQGSYGTFFAGANGAYQWRPDVSLEAVRALKPGELLEDLFTYTWTNAAGSTTGTYHGRIQGVDDPTRGVADVYHTTPNTYLNVDAEDGVLANDDDIDGNVGGATLISGPANGVLGFNTSGAFTYTPRLGFVGTDTFSYRPTTASGNDAATLVTIEVQPLVTNTAPVGVADSYAMVGAGPLVVAAAQGVLANDTDAQNDPFVAVLVTGAAHGTVTLNQDGSFTYAANAGFAGTDSFTYQANDGQLLSAVTTATITVPVNRAPVAPDAVRSTAEDTPLNGNLATIATDPDGEALSFTTVIGPQHGLLSLNAAGGFTYRPFANYAGTDSFTYGATDGRDSDTGRIDITITPVNDAPVANAASYVMQEDGVLVVQPPGPLAFASDADGDALTLVLITPPTNGTFAALANGGFSYTPPPNFFGSVTFGYAATDGQLQSNTAPVTITVLPQNDPPSASEDAATTAFNTPIFIDVLANDFDPDGDALTAVVRTGPSHGTAVVQADGTILYTPTAGYRGPDSFEYSAFDGVNLSVKAPVLVTVQPPPNVAPIAAPDSAVTNEDMPVIVNVLANDTPGDDDVLTVSIVIALNGTANVLADNTIQFTPSPDYNGFTSFTYRISDGQAFSDATVSVAVAPVPDAPRSFNDYFNVLYGTPIVLDPLAYEYDPDGDALIFNIISPAQHGSFTPVGDGTFLYTPNTGFSGQDVILYQLSDGVLTSAITRIEITVAAPLNTPPSANDGDRTTIEDTPLLDNLAYLASDLDRNPLTFSIITGPAHGQIVLNETTGAYTYTPDANYFGADEFQYGANDGDVTARATVRITVISDNDLPVVGSESVQTTTNTPIDVDVLANDYDPEGGALSLLIVQAPSSGNAVVTETNTIRFTPSPGFDGSTTITYRVTDPDGGHTDGYLTVTVVPPPNTPPTATSQAPTIAEDTKLVGNLLDYTFDADGDPLTPRLTALPEHGLLAFEPDTGKFTYTPATDFNGTDSFGFAVKDPDGAEATATIAITITPVPDAPSPRPDQVETPEDTATSGNVLANDDDPDGDALTAHLAAGTETSTSLGTLTFGADGAWSFVPLADVNGTAVFTYFASDGTLETPTTLTIVVAAVNDAPLAQDAAATTAEDTPASGTLTGFDIDGDPLSFTLAQGVSATSALGTLALDTSGAFVFTPAADAFGSVSYAFVASDGTLSDAATLSITVTPVNDAPVAQDAAATTAEDTATSGTLLANDVDGDALAFALAQGVSATTALGTLSLDALGGWVFTPAANAFGTASFDYTVSDGALTDTATLSITVTPVNDAPVAEDASATTAEDTATSGTLLANDVDGDALSFALAQGSSPATALGTLDLDAAGGWVFTPAPNASGSVTFDIVVSDGTLSDSATLSITVTPVNDAPVAQDASATTAEDTLASGTLTATDSDGTPLVFALDGGPIVTTALGTLSLTGAGDWVFIPAENATGSESFAYTVSDGTLSDTATLSITVTPVNDAPVAGSPTVITQANTAVSGTLPASDVDGDALSFALADGVNAISALGTLVLGPDGGWSFTPATDVDGSVTYAFRVSDGALDATGLLRIVVTPVGAPLNHPPVATNDDATVAEAASVTIDVLANDTDADLDTLSLVDFAVQPYFGTVAIVGGKVVYTANADAGGQTDFFRYIVADGQGGTAQGEVSVSITDVNTPPTAANDTATTNEDTPVVVDVLGNDSDDGATPLLVGITQGPTHGTATVTAAGEIRYVPGANFSGSDSIAYSVTDDAGQTATATLAILVEPVNDAPVATDDSATTPYNTPLSLALATLLANDTDIDSAPLFITGVANAVGGTAVIVGTNVVFTPTAGFSGQGGFEYTLSDGDLTDEGAVSVLVGSAPPPPPVGGLASLRFSDGATGTPRGSASGAPFTPQATIDRLLGAASNQDGGQDLEMKGAWNAIKNLDLSFTSGAAVGTWAVKNLVALYADFGGSTPGTAPGIDFTGIGLKRGVVSFGDGADTATWVAHSNGGEANGWSEQASIDMRGGDDVLRLFTVASSTLDDAMLAGRNNGALWNKNYDGKFSYFSIDLGAGNDTLTTVATDKMRINVRGGAGDDIITTAAGIDRIDGGAGADTMAGGAGNDVFVLRAGEIQGDRILDFTGAGVAGGDSIEFQGFGPGATVTALGGGLYRVGASETFELFNNGVAVTTLAAQDYLFA